MDSPTPTKPQTALGELNNERVPGGHDISERGDGGIVTEGRFLRPGQYVVVNGRYYQYVTPPGQPRPILIHVPRGYIADLYPKRGDRMALQTFVDFSTFPDNTPGYRQVIETSEGKFLNQYAGPLHVPHPGEWPHIKYFISHLFGEHTALALDYMRLLYLCPTEHLPVLVLLSAERATGKTTFLRLLSEIFGDNAVIVDNQAILTRFNAGWAGKLVVGIDEALINRRETSEMLKAIATSKEIWLEEKGRPRCLVPNHTHLVVCSNSLTDPLLIDGEETRYWVVVVPPFPADEMDPNALELMINEIPAFLFYLANEHVMAFPEKRSRLWFPFDAYRTEALLRIQQATVPTGHQVLATVVADVMAEIHTDAICMSYSDAQRLLTQRGLRSIKILPILKEWHNCGIADYANKTYQTYVSDDGKIQLSPIKKIGRFYTFYLNKLEKYL